jgi:bacillopeptidase F
MKKFVSLFVFAAALASSPALAAQIDPALQAFAQGRTQYRSARVIVIMKSNTDGRPAPRRYDSVRVIEFLQDGASRSATQLQAFLDSRQVGARDVKLVRGFWINNSVSVDVSPAGLRALAQAPGVTKIYANRVIGDERPLSRHRVPAPRRGRNLDETLAYPFRDTELSTLIQREPTIDGRGVTVGHLDTGVDGTHPALAGKIAKFWDSKTRTFTTPTDSGEHGSHTAGTIVGGDRQSVFIGVAPAGKLISAGDLGDYDGMLAAMQMFVDPDGNPATKDFPRSVSNSWNCEGAPDLELFYTAIGAWESTGILPVFSAGNAGPSPRSITKPHEHPATLAVAATGEDGKVTDFSSRGPGSFRGQDTQKPDLSAPGDKVRSSVPGGGYEEMSGTSMATPHVAGATALLLQVDATLTPDQLRKVLIGSVKPVDAEGNPGQRGQWNAVYGLGKLNIYEAVQMAKRLVRRKAESAFSPLPFFKTYEEAQVDSILEEEEVTVADLMAFPADANGEGWLTPEQIWN